MYSSSDDNPSKLVRDQISQHVRSIRVLMNQLDPAERLTCLNEIMISLLPARNNKPVSSQEKLTSRKNNSCTSLSEEENKIIQKLGENTADLFRTMSDDEDC